MLGGARATVLGGTVHLAEAADTDGLAAVDVAGNGSGANIEPVGVLGRHLLSGAGLDGVNPTWGTVTLAVDIEGPKEESVEGGKCVSAEVLTGNGQLSLTLQESSVCVDEFVRLNAEKDR